MIGTDERERVIDHRAARAAADLNRVVATRPMFEIRLRQRSSRGALIAAVCVAALVVAGLYVIGDRGSAERIPTGPNGGVVWTIGDLPDGWRVGSLRSSPGQPSDFRTNEFAVYGTASAADGPVIVLDRSSTDFGRLPGDADAHDFIEGTAGQRRFVLADGDGGQRFGWVEIGDGWVAFAARGLSDDLLRSLAASVTVDSTGAAAIADDQLIAGLELLGVGPYSVVAPTFWAGLLGQGEAVSTTWIDYVAPTEGTSASLIETRAVPSELAMLSTMSSRLTKTEIDGVTGWVVDVRGFGAAVVWQRDDATLLLTGSGLSTDQLVRLARSVRPAREGDLPDPRESAPAMNGAGETVPAGTSLSNGDDAPSDTLPAPSPPSSEDIVDVDGAVTVDEVSPNEVTLSASLDDGFEFDIEVFVVADVVRLVPHANGQDMGRWFGRPSSDPDSQLTVFGGGNATSVVAVTDNPAAATLEVLRSNGERFSLALTSVPAHPEMRFIGMVVPANQVISAKLLDGDGEILAESNP